MDPLGSTSRILTPDVVGKEHYEVARAVQQVLQRYKELQDIIAIMGMKDRQAAVLLGHVVDQLHDEHCLAHAGAAEEADLAALGVGADQVDYLDVVRCIAMSSTDGLVRGAKAVDTGSP